MRESALSKRIGSAPLQRTVLADRVSDSIKEAILSGKLEPGDRIVEMKLAKDLGVGTTAVREALFELESQGLVSRITGKGTFVTQLTAEDVEQILRVRLELEGLAARDSSVELLASAEKHADVVKAIRNSENARVCMESALQFFAEQEKRLLFQEQLNA